MSNTRVLHCLLGLALSLASFAVCAQQMDANSRRSSRDEGLSDSVRHVQRQTGGRVLRAESMQSDGRDINRITVVDRRGRVRVVTDDPALRDSRESRAEGRKGNPRGHDN